ncbi:MAG: RHS repeat-associated core domain-containing protein [Pseudomonas sp.]
MLSANNRDAQVSRTYFPNGLPQTETQRIRTLAELSDGGNFSSHAYTMTYTYDLNGRRTELLHPANLRPTLMFGIADKTRYEYHAFGELAKVIDPLSHEYRFTYTPGLQLDSLYLPRNVRENFTYNADGNVASHVARNGSGQLIRDVAIRYDGRGRQVRMRGLPDTLDAFHSGLGHLVKTEFRTGANTRSGDVAKLTTHELFTNDAMGNRRTATTHDSTFVNGVFAQRTFRDEVQTFAPQTGRLNGTDAIAIDTSWYDPAGNLTFTYQRIPSGSAPVQDRAFFYDAEGRLRAVDQRYFEGSGPLAPYQATFEEYRYDALGRRVWVRAQRLCDRYTDDYAMLECQQHLIRRTVWDGEHELWEIQMPGQDSSAYLEFDTVTVNLPRTAEGLDPHPYYGRVLYTHGLQLDQPVGITRVGYVDFKPGTARTEFQPFTVIPDWSLRGDPDRQYLAEPSVTRCTTGFAPCVLLDHPMRWLSYGAAPRLMDHWLGTVIENKADRSGVFYRRNRYYDQGTGRFTQEDPIGLAGGLNLYGFAGGDPVNFSDPFGLCKPITDPTCARFIAVGMTTGLAVGGAVSIACAYVTFGICAAGAAPIMGVFTGLGASLGGLASTLAPAFNEDAAASSNDEPQPQPTADQIISQEKKASIRRVFPGEMLGKTLDEISKIAKNKKAPEHAAAKRAKKLLNDNRFNKDQ